MVVDLTEKSFTEDVLKKPKAVVDFWAPWCGPCMNFKPIFEKVAGEITDVAFGKVNVDEQRELAMEFGVMSIPTIVFFKGGEEVGRFTGSMPEEALKSEIKKYLG